MEKKGALDESTTFDNNSAKDKALVFSFIYNKFKKGCMRQNILKLIKAGLWKKESKKAYAILENCTLCPRNCILSPNLKTYLQEN